MDYVFDMDATLFMIKEGENFINNTGPIQSSSISADGKNITVNRKSKRKSNLLYRVFMREIDITVFNVKRTYKCESNLLGNV